MKNVQPQAATGLVLVLAERSQRCEEGEAEQWTAAAQAANLNILLRQPQLFNFWPAAEARAGAEAEAEAEAALKRTG